MWLTFGEVHFTTVLFWTRSVDYVHSNAVPKGGRSSSKKISHSTSEPRMTQFGTEPKMVTIREPLTDIDVASPPPLGACECGAPRVGDAADLDYAGWWGEREREREREREKRREGECV